MSFSAEWLALREPADRRARSLRLLEKAANAAQRAAGDARPLILDLGSGTGATCRAYAEFLPTARWRLIDNDSNLLSIAESAAGSEAEPIAMDLARLSDLPLDGVHLVTASAVFDLVPAAWIESLAHLLASRRLPLHATLTYDGRMAFEPPDVDDRLVFAAFNRHQTGNKGLGPAMGPEAWALAARAFGNKGFSVRMEESDWVLDKGDAALVRELVAGIGRAAGEAGERSAPSWTARRLEGPGPTAAVIGHRDILAIPPV